MYSASNVARRDIAHEQPGTLERTQRRPLMCLARFHETGHLVMVLELRRSSDR